MTVAEAVRKFERLAKLCLYLVPMEEQWVKRMLEMFRPDISLSVEGGGDLPTMTIDCVERAYRAESTKSAQGYEAVYVREQEETG